MEDAMSDTAALALIVASFFVGLVAYYIWTKWAHELAHEIVTGVDGKTSLPLPQTWRSQLLYARFVYIAINTTSSVAIIAGISFQVGRLASSPGTTVVAYFLAAVTGLITAIYPVHAAFEFLALRKLLRQAP
jgi:hypothetical protein